MASWREEECQTCARLVCRNGVFFLFALSSQELCFFAGLSTCFLLLSIIHLATSRAQARRALTAAAAASNSLNVSVANGAITSRPVTPERSPRASHTLSPESANSAFTTPKAASVRSLALSKGLCGLSSLSHLVASSTHHTVAPCTAGAHCASVQCGTS